MNQETQSNNKPIESSNHQKMSVQIPQKHQSASEQWANYGPDSPEFLSSPTLAHLSSAEDCILNEYEAQLKDQMGRLMEKNNERRFTLDADIAPSNTTNHLSRFQMNRRNLSLEDEKNFSRLQSSQVLSPARTDINRVKEATNSIAQVNHEKSKFQIESSNRIPSLSHRYMRLSHAMMDISIFPFRQKVEKGFDQCRRHLHLERSILKEINQQHFLPLVLLLVITSNAEMTPWILAISSMRLVRISWRFMVHSLVVVGMGFYSWERRKEKTKQLKRINNQANLPNNRQNSQDIPNNIKEPMASHQTLPEVVSNQPSLHTVVSYSALHGLIRCTCITASVMVYDYTPIGHALILADLSDFWLVVARYAKAKWTSRKQLILSTDQSLAYHQLEPGSIILIIIGIVLILSDCFRTKYYPFESSMLNTGYMSQTTLTRMMADLLCIVTSAFSAYTATIQQFKLPYPPYKSMMIRNTWQFFWLVLIGYFFFGVTFDSDPNYGLFSYLTSPTSLLYVGFVMGASTLMTASLIAKMFPSPIIPSIGLEVGNLLTVASLEWLGVQAGVGGVALLGIGIIVMGRIIGLIGDWLRLKKLQAEGLD